MPNVAETISSEKSLQQLIEEKFKVIESKLAEMNDLQIVNKLDIINLKNSIEKLKLGEIELAPTGEKKPASSNVQNDIVKLSKRLALIEKRGGIKPMPPPPRVIPKEIKSEMISLSKRLGALESKPTATLAKPETTPATQLTRIDKLENELASISNRISELKPVKIPEGVKDIDVHKTDIDQLKSDIEILKNKAGKVPEPLTHSPSTEPKELEEIRRKANQSLMSVKNIMDYVKANQLHIDELEKKVSKDHPESHTMPTESADIDKIKSDIEDLKQRVENKEPIAQPSGPSEVPKKGMAGVLGKISNLESNLKNVQDELEKEKKENIATQAQTSNFFRDVKKNKEKLEKLEQTDTRKIEKEIHRRLEKLGDKMNDLSGSEKDYKERIENEIRLMRKDSEQMRILKESIERMGVENITRELESLKQRIKHLEDGIGKININLLYEKIKEIEEMVSNFRPAPYVIE